MEGFKYFYPNVYDEPEQEKFIKDYLTKFDRLAQRGECDVESIINGTADGNYPGWDGYHPFEITEEVAKEYSDIYASDLPLFTDDAYTKGLGYEGKLAFPLVIGPDYMDAMPPVGTGDYLVVSGHNDYLHFLKPVYPGDTLYMVQDVAGADDITPEQGSYYRTYALWGMGSVYNQKGEKVMEGGNILKESYRTHADPEKRNKGFRHWESPDWWGLRKPYIYTDEDWKFIKQLWSEEKNRCGEVVYWDDVQIGESPAWTVDGPFYCNFETDIAFGYPESAMMIRKAMEDPELSKRMIKNKYGIWTLPEYDNLTGKIPNDPRPAGSQVLNPESDGRNAIQNSLAAKFAVRMLTYWMGKGGWLEEIYWQIMPRIPGYDDSIPDFSWKPECFNKGRYLDRVPYMRGKKALHHMLANDLCVNKSYVVDKYERDGKYFAELIWWCETMEGYIVQEGCAVIRLPKRP